MGLLNHLMFDDISSWTYGFYIDGQATFDAPARRGETVTVPGRNGTLFLDENTFENITVEYKCFFAADTEEDFQEQLAGFRAALMSKRGYLRLTDTYHPEEYRLATYKSGLEIDPIMYNRAGGFKLAFDCKPQRYLLSGDSEYTNPWMIENTTLFPASPLLKIYGYGELGINDKVISVENKTLGKMIFLGIRRNYDSEVLYSPFTHDTFNTGDSASTDFTWQATFTVPDASPGTVSAQASSIGSGLIVPNIEVSDSGAVSVKIQWPKADFLAGVASSITKSVSIRVDFTDSQSQVDTYTTVGISTVISFTTTGVEMAAVTVSDGTKVSEYKIIDTGVVYSSVSALGNPLYIDCESGEAYKYEDGEKISVNSSVWLGETLPTLEPGNTYFMHDGTEMPTVIVVPRWWTL